MGTDALWSDQGKGFRGAQHYQDHITVSDNDVRYVQWIKEYEFSQWRVTTTLHLCLLITSCTYSPLVAQNFEMDLDTKKIESHFLSKKRGISFSKLNCLKITLASPFYFQGATAILGERQSEGTGQTTKKCTFV